MATRLPRGITKTPKGWRVSLRVHGRLWQKRFPAATAQDDVEKELHDKRAALPAGLAPAEPADTFSDDVRGYLAAYMAGRAGADERRRHLALWTTALGGTTVRAEITRDDVARILNGWRADGLAADTCNKRRTALLALYHALDGKGASNPVREVPKFRPPDPLPRGLPYVQIERALKRLSWCKTRARLTVMAYTGLRPGQLMKLRAADWDQRRRVLLVPGTTKGRGTKPYVLPLSARATEALKRFDRYEAWGRFTWAPMGRMWKAAALKVGLPADTRVYDLRHSFGTAVYRQTGDLKVTKELLGHSSLRMTERYTLAAVPARRKAAIALTFPAPKKRSA